MVMSKDQQRVQKAFIAKEKAKIAPRRSKKKAFLSKYHPELLDPVHPIPKSRA